MAGVCTTRGRAAYQKAFRVSDEGVVNYLALTSSKEILQCGPTGNLLTHDVSWLRIILVHLNGSFSAKC